MIAAMNFLRGLPHAPGGAGRSHGSGDLPAGAASYRWWRRKITMAGREMAGREGELDA